MAVAAFNSDKEALDFLYGGPVGDPQLDIAPEAPEVLPIEAAQVPLPGAIDPNVQAVLDENAALEPPLPQEAEDAPLPPVVPPPAATFATDEEAMSFLRAEQPPAAAGGEARPPGEFATDEEALAFLKGAEAPKALELSFGGQEAALAKAVMSEAKPVRKPVTTPEAADGSDVTFDPKGPAFKFSGALVVEPGTGPTTGVDGLRMVPPAGPVANAPEAAALEPALNRRPRLVPTEGQIVFDQSSPERFTQGVEEAYASGILPQANYEKIKAASEQIFKVVEDRRKLEEKAQADPKLLAALQGFGRGGAITLGAIGGAKVGAAGGAAIGTAIAGPPGTGVGGLLGGTGGAIVGGIAAGVGYDALYNELGKHFEEYDNVMKSAELYPMHKAGGELAMAGLAIATSVPQAVRGLQAAYQSGGLAGASKMGTQAMGLGAGTGAVAYPIDAAVRGEEITPGGFATAAGAGMLMGGFFINGKPGTAQDLARVLVKVKMGQPLTAAESALLRAATPAMDAAYAQMEAAGGVRSGPVELNVWQASVGGMSPVAGKATAKVPYRVPLRLPEGAVPRAQAAAAEAGPRALGVPQGQPTAAAGDGRPPGMVVPREAPVNVLPPGTAPIAMSGPTAAGQAVASGAAMEPFNWVLDTARERGIDLEDPESNNWNALLAEHYELVKTAIEEQQPVAARAFEVYDLSVPYYEPDPESGMAVFNAQAFKDYEEYLTGRGEEFRQDMSDAGGVELLAAVAELGGLPSRQAAGSRRSAWSGELESLLQTAQGAGKGKGSDNQKGVFLNKLFRKDGKDLDDIVTGLRGRGFMVETPQQLIDMLDMRLRTGREVWALATEGMDEVPLELRGAAPRPAGPAVATGEQTQGVDIAADQKYGGIDPLIAEETASLLRAEGPSREYQLAFNFDAAGQPGPALERGAGSGTAGTEATGAVDRRRSRVKILGLAVQHVGTTRPGALLGERITSARDVAVLSQIYRDPRFETLRVYYLKGDQVVHETAVTSRHAGTTAFLPDKGAQTVDRFAADVRAQMDRLGATSFYLIHNHPSGRPDPSSGDVQVTRELSKIFGAEFEGHVVINSGKYSLVVSDPNVRQGAVYDLPQNQPDPILGKTAVPHQVIGRRIAGPQDVAALAKQIEEDPKAYTVLTTDNQNVVRSVLHVDLDMLVDSPTRFAALMSRLLRTTASRRLFITGVPDAQFETAVNQMAYRKPMMEAIQKGFITDVVSESGRSYMEQFAMRLSDLQAGRGVDVGRTVQEESAPFSTDPLTPPSSVRAGGPAKVPPGTPVGMAAINPPDWVTAPGETSAGRRLIKGIENFRPGQRWGFRAIVDFVNEAVRMEMRRSTSQTGATHPAHYKPAHHMAYTRATQSQINFHEAGHGLEYLIRARVPDFFNAYADELLALANRPGSMASDAPGSLSPAGQRQYRIGEGVAEWTRLLMVDPAAVQRLKVTAAIAEVAERFYPGMAKSLRDGARAVNAFQAADVATRWAMFNAVPGANPGANELIGAVVRGGEAAVNMIASGAPVSALDRKITRAIIKQRKETETAYGAAVKKARETRALNLTPLMSAYNMVLSIGAETQLAISGQSISKGLRIVEDDGSFHYLTHETWRELRKKVPGRLLAQFDQAAWAKESLNRYENGGLEYPGMREGISPNDLRAIVAAAEAEIPNFTRMYKEQSRFHDLILEVKEAGGLISGEDRQRMQTARPGYWPLPRVMTVGRGRGGRGRGDISAGVFRARGSGEAIRQIDEVTEERVREMFEAYYWNRFGTKLYDNMLKVAKDTSLPAEARRIAGASMIKLKMPMQSAAKVSKEQALGWVMKAIGDAYERVLGFRPEVKAEDVNLSWSFRDVWRPVRPTDVNVVSLLRDGQREYYQIGDPAMFALFSRPQEARAAGKFVSWALGPMTENWKRNITQGLVFAVRNMFRDVFTQPMMNPDPVGWVPGWAHWKGVVNKWTQKYPQVFSEGLLLSRVEPSGSEMVNTIKHGAVWQWLTEGFYVSQAKDPIVRTLATVLQPSNWLFPLWKTVDLVNLVTGGKTMAQFMETAGREGAAVAALERGATDEEALAKYWTAAGQFNEHPGNADARIMMRIPGFLNPMLQGLRNQVQKLTDPDPAVAGTTWLRLLAMMPVAFGGAAIVRYLLMNEEDKEKERQRPVDDRMNFMDLGGFAIPFPFGVEGVMGSLVYNAAMDDLLGRPKVDADRTAWMMLRRIADPGSALQFFGPQLATLTEAQMNWSSFRQKPIVAPWMVNLPAGEQYASTTPEFYRKLGTWMNYSPAKLQYIVQQAISRQADETIRLAESLDRGRPIAEPADVPFVGRMFVRDPIGFSSQAVRSVGAVEDKLHALDTRLKAKGWWGLRDGSFPADKIGSQELRLMQVQLAYLEDLRRGLGVLNDMQGMGKVYALARDYANERNVRALQTQYAQSLLVGNRERLAVLEQALQLIKQIPEASPEQKANEYLQRRF